jgi:hypothetical protein
MATTSSLRLIKLLNEFLRLPKHIVGYLDKAYLGGWSNLAVREQDEVNRTNNCRAHVKTSLGNHSLRQLRKVLANQRQSGNFEAHESHLPRNTRCSSAESVFLRRSHVPRSLSQAGHESARRDNPLDSRAANWNCNVSIFADRSSFSVAAQRRAQINAKPRLQFEQKSEHQCDRAQRQCNLAATTRKRSVRLGLLHLKTFLVPQASSVKPSRWLKAATSWPSSSSNRSQAARGRKNGVICDADRGQHARWRNTARQPGGRSAK